MSIRQVRSDIRQWIEGYIPIRTWDLDTPINSSWWIDGVRYPSSSAVEAPMENFNMRFQADRVVGRADLPYIIVWRFNGEAAMNQLPITDVELVVNFLSERMCSDFESISDVIEFAEVAGNESPVRLSRVEGEDSDWLLAAFMEFRISWNSNVWECPGTVPSNVSGEPSVNQTATGDRFPIETILMPDINPPDPVVGRLTAPGEPLTVRIGLNRSKAPSVNPDDESSYGTDVDISFLTNYS